MFHLQMGPDTLVGLVLKNGPLHWGADSVATVLQYKAVYQFSHSRHTVAFQDLKSTFLPATQREQKTRFISHSRLLHVLGKSKSAYIKTIYDRLRKGNFHVKKFVDGVFRECLSDVPGSKPFLPFLEEYQRELLTIGRTLPAAETLPDSMLPPRKRRRPTMDSPASPEPSSSSSSYIPTSPAMPPPSPEMPLLSPKMPPPSPEMPPPSPEMPPPSPGDSPPPRYSVYTPVLERSLSPLDLRTPSAAPASTDGSFSFWMDQVPPTKIFVFQGSCCKSFFERRDNL